MPHSRNSSAAVGHAVTRQARCKWLWKISIRCVWYILPFCSMFLFSKRCSFVEKAVLNVYDFTHRCRSLNWKVDCLYEFLETWDLRPNPGLKLFCSLPNYSPVSWGRRPTAAGLFGWSCSIKGIYCMNELTVFYKARSSIVIPDIWI